MYKQIIKETLKYMWRNKKNRLVMVLSLGVVLVHSLLILPNLTEDFDVDVAQLERSIVSNQQTFEDRLETGQTLPSFFTGTSAYQQARNEYVNQRELLTAMRTGDARRYLTINYRPQEDPGSVMEDEGFNIPILGYAQEREFQAMKNQVYVNEVEPLSFHHIHDRTSLQQMHLFLIGWGPYILIFLLLFMISDVVTKDRKLTTQKLGVSKNWFTYLMVQSLAALGFVALFFAVITGIFYLVNGIQYGFGFGSLPAGAFEAAPEGEPFHASIWSVIDLSTFFIRALPLLALLLYSFTRLNTLVSLIVKQDVVVLIATSFALLFPFLYYGEETTELLGLNISWYPQTYYQVGGAATGMIDAIVQEPVPYSRGIIVLLVTLLIIEGLNYLASKLITRQTFLG